MIRMKLWSVTWETTTAGPSPDKNNRTEIFLFGCKKAKLGNPCKGCFNQDLWDSDKAEKDYTPEEIATQIIKHAPNKYVTIGGGEPTDQMEGLIELCELLKEAGFHIMVYTWNSLLNIFGPEVNKFRYRDLPFFEFKQQMRQLLNCIDIMADGQFVLEERLYQPGKDDGLLNSVGSGNQIIWDVRPWKENHEKYIEGYALKDLDALFLKDNNDLLYLVKNMGKEAEQVRVDMV